MKTDKKLKLLAPLLLALVLTAALLALYLWDTNRIQKRDITEFDTDTAGWVWQVEQVEDGGFFTAMQGYCYPAGTLHDYYNFGIDVRGRGVYFCTKLALVQGDAVLVLPTVAMRRPELLDAPEAAAIRETPAYNFFAGVQARVVRLLVPAGSWQVGFVTADMDGREYLLLTDREWVNG